RQRIERDPHRSGYEPAAPDDRRGRQVATGCHAGIRTAWTEHGAIEGTRHRPLQHRHALAARRGFHSRRLWRLRGSSCRGGEAAAGGGPTRAHPAHDRYRATAAPRRQGRRARQAAAVAARGFCGRSSRAHDRPASLRPRPEGPDFRSAGSVAGSIASAGSRALAGIGCHYMAQWMDRDTTTFTQMGGEGASWIGQAPFTAAEHVFVNLGDGTYAHSGLLAIRAAIAAGVTITYKLLYNDAVAMTGGQTAEGGFTVAQIARQLAAEGVGKIYIVAEE